MKKMALSFIMALCVLIGFDAVNHDRSGGIIATQAAAAPANPASDFDYQLIPSGGGHCHNRLSRHGDGGGYSQ